MGTDQPGFSHTRFESSRTGFQISRALTMALILLTVIFGLTGIFTLAALCIVTGIYTGYSTYASYVGFKEVLVYDDRIEIVNYIGEVLGQVYYSDVKNIGFLRSQAIPYSRFDDEGMRKEDMVILLKDGGRVDLWNDIVNLHELCGIIQSRVS